MVEVGLDGKTILKAAIKKQGIKLWIGFIRLRVGFTGGLL
jgi:hypothetical protein